MMLAILSDIHANLEALEAVLLHARERDVSEIVCLGDVVGYGPNPRETCAIARKEFRLTLRGNHEQGIVFFPVGFNERARRALEWTRGRLLSDACSSTENDELWRFLCALPEHRLEGDTLYVHGSPLDPVTQYVFPQDAQDPDSMSRLFARIDRRAFCGHTHQPGVFIEGEGYKHPDELNGTYTPGEKKILVNVGSVGQPRDGDNRACYLTFDGATMKWHRVPYDYGRTKAKIFEIKELSPTFGDRLEKGT
ncbi:MAG: metallophosphoesterase family protein [Planctomycetes bacterium]|nr:metallophosphoesterase family protein [Planctomycetota bacterium]